MSLTLVTERRRIETIPTDDKRILSTEGHDLVLDAYRSRLDLDIDRVEPELFGVLRDALDHPGSLLRAQLAFDVQRRHGVDFEAALDLAIGVEYFHTASLLFDDLPSMDDGAERRGRTCPHRVWGEAATQLAGLALITRAYELLWHSFGTLEPARARRAASLAGACLGVRGILDGQSRDLHPPKIWTSREVERVAAGKTVTLIRLSLVLPALVSGAGEGELEQLEALARAWGLAYQVVDDFKDHLLTAEESGKTPQRDRRLRRPNLPAVLGADAALIRLQGLLGEGNESIRQLQRLASRQGAVNRRQVAVDRWHRLASVQEILEADFADIAARLELRACA